MTIGERMRRVRIAAGAKQREFAAACHKQPNTIATYESDKAIPSEGVIADLCAAYNINRDWLLTGAGGDDAMFNPKSDADTIASLLATISGAPEGSYVNRLAKGLAALTPEDWEHLAQIAEKMADALK